MTGYVSLATVGCGVLFTLAGWFLLRLRDRLGNEFRFLFGLCSMTSGGLVVLVNGSQFLLMYAIRDSWPQGVFEWVAVAGLIFAAIGPILVGVRMLRGES